jgi:LuxR family maltose regulon positive regulatory protein
MLAAGHSARGDAPWEIEVGLSPTARERMVAQERMVAPGVLERKLAPPTGRAGLVVRERLLARLRGARDVPVLAVAAPPGYGKTTLLSQWIERDGRPSGWLTVDDRDNDPALLLEYLAAALDRIEPSQVRDVVALMRGRRTVYDAALPAFQASLASMRVPFLLVIDDVHALTNPESLDIVAAAVDAIPAGSQIAVASRDIPRLPLGRLRATRRLQELGTDDLALDIGESAQLLRLAGVPLLPADVQRLTERTEGWPAGLYLAALSIQAAGSTAAVHATFRGTDQFVTDFLRSELLSRLDPDDVTFLRRTSVLGELCGPLVDHALGTTGSASRLDALARSNLFVVPIDRNRVWYRYHTLFRELLAAELRDNDPELVPVLLGRTADWYEAQDAPEQALAVAFDAGDTARAARIVARIGLPAYWEGRFAALRGWIARFGDAINQHPAAAVLGALTAILDGEPANAEWLLEAATGSAGDAADAVPGLHTVKAIMLRDGLRQARADAERGLAAAPPGQPLRALALLVLGTILDAQGEDEAAEAVLAEHTEGATGSAAAPGRSLALAFRARRALDRGDWTAAESFIKRARGLVATHHLGEYSTTGVVAAVSARVAISHRDLGHAAADLVDAQRLRPSMTYAAPMVAVYARVEMGRAYLALGDTAGARTMVAEADEIRRVRPDLGVVLGRLDDLRKRAAAAPVGHAAGASTLTPAELRLLPYLQTHLSYRDIGNRLGVTSNTIKTHAGGIFAKLDVSRRAEAVDKAREVGLLES